MRISVCITVLNEEKNIGYLLDSLISQILKPFEVIIIDANSKDRTKEVIKHYCKKYSYIKLLNEPGSIAHCRNVAVELANSDIIVMTDAGCIPEKNWVEEITKPFTVFKGEIVVAGFYNMPFTNPFQEAARLYLGVPPERFDGKKFLPSTRSVAFSKSVWERVEGFDELLEKGGEDTKFLYQAVKENVKIVRVGQARVDWVEISQIDLNSFMGKIYFYAKGDRQTGVWWHPLKLLSSHNIKISLVFLRYLIFLSLLTLSLASSLSPVIFLILFGLYLIWPIYKWRDVKKSFKANLWLPIIQLISDLQVMRGFRAGTISKKAK